ncbi:hypothetical protein PtA15_16A379 [Puccinia triticina]|uniref:NADH dehydrogenase (Ubiquinone) 1 alpha subcomplex 4 n=1 Tax=Puccinia triticina TaxID=208348 RepID=A0ABY7D7Z7_9BASI|nr:uncharacterized protein PtA15_16A379 [Puccinia triticina]WAQ92471.1 hypothetical protein PtA15_16A379 [Puccinia triticina]WAR64214.1 hypothetical protein PtB15_16B374 [Puccinia triticina]
MSFRAAMKHWYDPAVRLHIPFHSGSPELMFPYVSILSTTHLFRRSQFVDVVIGTAMGGATWYLSRLARGPDIVWNRHGNPQPWNDVKPGQNTKLMAVNQEFPNGTYKRDRL